MKTNSKIAVHTPQRMLSIILIAGLLSGLLDALAASLVYYRTIGLSPGQVMQFVPSGTYGHKAFTGGTEMIVIGTLLHFLIAFTFAFVYYAGYLRLSELRASPLLSGLIYGLSIWIFMNFLIMPFSNIQNMPFDPFLATIGVIWHILLLGMPISMITAALLNKRG